MQQLNPSEISEVIKKRIEGLNVSSEAKNEGTIVSVSDGIVRIHGLADVMYGEMIAFDGGLFGMALNLERDSVGAVVLGDYKGLAEGQKCHCTGRILEVPVGPGLMGRVLDALGNPIDGKGPVEAVGTDAIEKVAPGVIARQSVDQPLQTGYKAVDAMVPIGRGQRELIIGDRQTGKTAMAIDAIIAQKDTGVKCVYVAIGQKQSTIANVVRKLEEHDALKHTIIVAASASTPASMQFLAPYAGCTMGEYFRDRGEDALIVYDDLSKQAVAYRQISLLLRRPPGREAYPGDVFYLHSRLLERASRVNAEEVEKLTKGEVKGKTGSLTALPIIETQGGDVSAFVPTNVISITDGQIFLETNLFNSGIRPAMNAGISVSRVGGAAQTKIVKKLSGGIRTALAQYRELAAFSQFASDLDEATRAQLDHGERVTELMKQAQYAPLSIAQMAVSIFAANEGYLKDVAVSDIGSFESDLHKFMQAEYADLMKDIVASGKYDDSIEKAFREGIEKFKASRS
ncbi:F0F1 ATP synthase subunit alpha [Salinispirillum sp. LH 10-3-1]|uniref:ATP synthase subunit alpha n=1 Tax=Salinispirillum sp. LH 10-3-1 TaxID=2952525 RepID=A0AB38YG97_9GAMM